MFRQPPCEAVSWNLSTLSDIIERFGQPPCEAVSWNIISTMCTHRMTVSLLVRLWVEIWKILQQYYRKEGQPPCEAVSWNGITRNSILSVAVSLLVRLWVEIHLKVLYMVIQLSASLWGCELKYILGCVAGYVIIGQPPCEAVSWNVHHGRTQNKHVCQPPCEAVSWNIKNITHLLPWPLSASLWGCELKST